MSLQRKIMIDGKEVTFRASAAIPRMYRIRFRRDIYKDLAQLSEAVSDGDPENSDITLLNLELFENIAYLMAWHADPSIPDSVEEWLEQFNTFSIYEVLPQLIELWGLNVETTVQAKKNKIEQSGR